MPHIRELFNNPTNSDISLKLQDGSTLFGHCYILQFTADILGTFVDNNNSQFTGNIPTDCDFTQFNSTSVCVVVALIYGNKLSRAWKMQNLKFSKEDRYKKYRCNSIILLDIYQFAIYLGCDWIVEKINGACIRVSHEKLIPLLTFGITQESPIFMNEIENALIDDQTLIDFAKVDLPKLHNILNWLQNEENYDAMLHLIVFYNLTHEIPIETNNYNDISHTCWYALQHKCIIAVTVARAYIRDDPLADVYFIRAMILLNWLQIFEDQDDSYQCTMQQIYDTMIHAKIKGASYGSRNVIFTNINYKLRQCKNVSWNN